MRVCPNCGEQNPERARFCMACSARLEVELEAESRRVVTIVFSDLKGSTNLGEALDPETFRDVMSRYFDAMRAAVERHGGTVEKFIGDAVMAVFGLPRVHEDDALRAVRAVRDMGHALEELNRELDDRWGVTLQSRTGVHTGEVVVGDPSTGQRLATGDAVNTAARLEQAAPPGEALLGETTYRLVRGAVQTEPAVPLELKGKSEPIRAYRLVEGLPIVPRGRMNVELVGRTDDLQVLESALDRVTASGAPELVTVSGDPGVGKSRLLREFGERTADRATTVTGRCPAYGEGITLFPFAEVVRQAAQLGDDDPVAIRQQLDRVLHGHEKPRPILERLEMIVGLAREPGALDELFWAVRKLMEHLAASRPLIVVFDDVHWAEDAFFEFVDQVDVTVRGPVLLVCATRHDLFEDRPDWPRSGIRLSLEPLTAGDVDDLITKGLGESSDELRQRIHRAAEGNPLFVEQIIAMLLDEGSVTSEDGRLSAVRDLEELVVTPTIAALLAARLDRLPNVERLVVERASIAGHVFTLPGVRELCPPEVREDLHGILGSLGQRRFVEADDGVGGGLRFAHVLIQEAAYEGILKKHRAELHERFASWLSTTESAQLKTDEVVGYHLEQAWRSRTELSLRDDHTEDLGLRAARSLATAGERALDRGDIGAAANLLGRAVAVSPENGAALGWAVDLGAALREAGRIEESIDTLDRTVASARAAGHVEIANRGEIERFGVDVMTGGTPGWTERAAAAADRMIPDLEERHDDRGLAKAWRMVSWVRGWAGDLRGWDEASLRSIEYARRAGDRREEIEVVAGLAISAAFGRTPADEGVRRCEELLAEVEGNRRAEAFVMGCLSLAQGLIGEFDAARMSDRRCWDGMREIGAFVHMSSNIQSAALIERLAGESFEAERVIRERIRELESLRIEIRGSVHTELGRALSDLGRDEEAAPFVEVGRDPSDPFYGLLGQSIRGRVRARLGRVDEGLSDTSEAVEILRETDELVVLGEVLIDHAEVLALAGQRQESQAAAEESIRLWTEKKSSVGAAMVERAMRSRPIMRSSPT